MLALKLCIVCLLAFGIGVGCQALEQPEPRLSNGQASTASTQSGRKAWFLGPEKVNRRKSTNVHIENIYVPQNIQHGDNFGPEYAVYPAYTYNKNPQYYAIDDDSEIPTDLSKLGIQSTLNAQQVYAQLKPEQNNGYVTVQYPNLFSQNTQKPQLATTENGKYYLIVNTANTKGSQRPAVSYVAEADDNEKEDSDMSTVESEILYTPIKRKSKPIQLQAASMQHKAPQKLKDNQGLSLAKYLLGHSLNSAAGDMESTKVQQMKTNSKVHKADQEEEKEDNERMVDDDDDTEVVEVEDDDAGYSTQSTSGWDTKDIKLPLEFILGLNRPLKKVDDRVALVYLRRTKQGRKMWQSVEA